MGWLRRLWWRYSTAAAEVCFLSSTGWMALVNEFTSCMKPCSFLNVSLLTGVWGTWYITRTYRSITNQTCSYRGFQVLSGRHVVIHSWGRQTDTTLRVTSCMDTLLEAVSVFNTSHADRSCNIPKPCSQHASVLEGIFFRLKGKD